VKSRFLGLVYLSVMLVAGYFRSPLLLGADLTRADELEQAVDLARRTLEFVERERRCPALAARLSELERRAAELPSAAGAQRASLRTAVRQLRREIIFAHPRLDFDRLLVNKRPPPAYSHQSRQYLGRYSRPGPGLVVLDHWKDRPRETLLLSGKLPPGTVMHPELSFDARRVVFSFCDHSPPTRTCGSSSSGKSGSTGTGCGN
jgi:hypothetical protein